MSPRTVAGSIDSRVDGIQHRAPSQGADDWDMEKSRGFSSTAFGSTEGQTLCLVSVGLSDVAATVLVTQETRG